MKTMAETLRADLLAVAQIYATAKGLKLSSLGNYVRGDSTYFIKLKRGKTRMVCEVYDEIMQWLSDRWPEDVRWPPHVARPNPKPLPATKRKIA